MTDIEYDQQHPREVIKCVLIGDSGVGKTRLICAEAVGVGMKAPLPLRHFHYPSVFAIDQYHVSDDIRDRASFVVDGVNVALRLWDTFGDHGMNRKYAYQNAHVVMLCFNISSPASFKNVNALWYPEIKRFCPRTPIILVGTQSDWRCSNSIISITTSKATSLSKRMRECVLVTPDMGRQVAREIGATYYETSVVTMFSVRKVFENAIRAALVARRQTRFWSSQLKRVSKPLLQQPYLPEKSTVPTIVVPESQYQKNLHEILHVGECTDVKFVVGQQVIEAHSSVLCCSSALFSHLLLKQGLFGSNYDDESHLIKCLTSGEEQVEFLQNALLLGKPALLPRGFFSISMIEEKVGDRQLVKIVVEVDSSIPSSAFENILNFLYSGNLPISACTEELLKVTHYLQLSGISNYIDNIINSTSYMNKDIARRMFFGGKVLLNQKCMSDISFILQGKTVHAHKSFLVSQCEMLAAMFMEGHFKESGHQVVDLKEVSSYSSFLTVLEYLYTDHCPVLSLDEAIDVIGLANFFCLSRLVASCEQIISKELQVAMATDELSIAEDVIACLIESQLHNATQLESWCLHYIASHYVEVCRKHPKEFKMLSPATHRCLNQQRWPPIWYLIENDWYEKSKRELDQLNKKGVLKSAVKSKKKKCHCL